MSGIKGRFKAVFFQVKADRMNEPRDVDIIQISGVVAEERLHQWLLPSRFTFHLLQPITGRPEKAVLLILFGSNCKCKTRKAYSPKSLILPIRVTRLPWVAVLRLASALPAPPSPGPPETLARPSGHKP